MLLKVNRTGNWCNCLQLQEKELKDSLNESYQDLLEMIETRLQSLKASWELHKFLHDCKDILLTMQERRNAIPDEIGRDQQSVQQLLRKHQQYETELVSLAQDIQRIQEESKRLDGRYAGEKETEIKRKENDVLSNWKLLQQSVDQRKRLLNDYDDLHRFFNLTRDLHMWMDGMIQQMNNSSKPRDVSGVDLLMNNHQSLKAEIDARQENFTMCINLGMSNICSVLFSFLFSSLRFSFSFIQYNNRKDCMIILIYQYIDKYYKIQLIDFVDIHFLFGISID